MHEAVTSRQLALIEGEPGIGKTRLAEEFLRGQPGVHLRSAAHELEHGLPYQPVIDALRGLFATPDWPRAAPANQLAGRVAHRTRAPGSRNQSDRRSHLAQNARSTADESRLWESVHQFLVALSRLTPIVVFLDDAQWADNSTLGLLGYLVRVTAASTHPIVFVAASRPIGPRTPIGALVQTLTREGRLMRIPLDRLSSSDTAALAQQISPAFAFPLADWLMQQSEGNPYILSESINHARESGLLHADGISEPQRVVVVARRAAQHLQPHSSAPARACLIRRAAFWTRPWPPGACLNLKSSCARRRYPRTAALDALDELRAARLIEPQGSDGLHYAFDHSLTMEVAYREVGEPRHRLLHRRVAEAMEAIYGRQRLDAIAGLLAWHYLESGDAPRAAPYALRAAQLAMQFAAWREAIEFYEQALHVDLPPLERAAILMELGEAHFRAGETAQASEAYRSALQLCAPDSLEADRARLALAQALLNQARYAEAIASGQARARCRTRGVDRQRRDAVGHDVIRRGRGSDRGGRTSAIRPKRCCVNNPDQPGCRAAWRRSNSSKAVWPRSKAIWKKRWRCIVKRLCSATQADKAALPFAVLGYNNLAYHLHLLHDPTAIDYARQGLQLAHEQGALGIQPYLLSTLGEIELDHDLEAAEKYFTDGLALSERLSMPERMAGLTANLGRVAQRRGETTLAIHRLSTALAKAEALGLPHLTAQIRVWLAPLLPPLKRGRNWPRLVRLQKAAGGNGCWRRLSKLEREVNV